MPFKSDAQRRWMYANEPALARKWSRDYKDGGVVTSGTMNMKDGGRVGHAGRQKNWGSRRDMIGEDLANIGKTLLEFTPIIGDLITAKEMSDAIEGKDYASAAILGVALAIGLVPGVGDAIAAPLKAAARKLPVADMQGIARALKDGDMEFLKSYKGADQAKSAGARAAAEKTIYIPGPDGKPVAITGTPAELKEKYGVNPKALSDKSRTTGRTSDGTQWSKDGNFTDFKTGKTVKQEEVTRMDAASIGFSDSRAALPRSFSTELRDDLEEVVDTAIVNAEQRYIDKVGIDDFKETQVAAEAIAADAWEEVVQGLNRFDNQLTTEQRNKVLQWAKNRTRSVFDVVKTAGDDATKTYVQQPGASRRRILASQGKRFHDEDITFKGRTFQQLVKEVGNDEATTLWRNLKAGIEAGILDRNGNVIDKGIIKRGDRRQQRGILSLDKDPAPTSGGILAPTRRRRHR